MEMAALPGDPVLVDQGLRFTVKEPRVEVPERAVRPYTTITTKESQETAALLVRLQVENVDGDWTESLVFLESDFAVLAASGAMYDESCDRIRATFDQLQTLVTLGRMTEGDLCIMMPRDEEALFLLYRSPMGSERRYFRLTP